MESPVLVKPGCYIFYKLKCGSVPGYTSSGIAKTTTLCAKTIAQWPKHTPLRPQTTAHAVKTAAYERKTTAQTVKRPAEWQKTSDQTVKTATR